MVPSLSVQFLLPAHVARSCGTEGYKAYISGELHNGNQELSRFPKTETIRPTYRHCGPGRKIYASDQAR